MPDRRRDDDDVEDLLDDLRRQTQRRLVEQKQAGLAHERPCDGEHLLLAAGEGDRQAGRRRSLRRGNSELLLHLRIERVVREPSGNRRRG